MATYAGRPVGSVGSQFIWVQGYEAAKAYPVAPGNSVPMFDTENNVFYVKSVDANGFPQRLVVNEYTDVTDQYEKTIANPENFVTEDKLNEILDKKFDDLFKKLNGRPQNNYKHNPNKRCRDEVKENEDE